MSRFLVRSSVFAVFAAAAAMLVGLLAGPAAAHSALIGSTPEQGAQVATAPERVTLTFNEELKPAYAILKIVGPDNHFWQPTDPTVSGKEMSVDLNGLGPVGEYKINYRVTSADGHPVEGQISFELTQPGTGQPGALVDDSQSESAPDHGVPAWPFIVGGVILVLFIAGVLAMTVAKRRN